MSKHQRATMECPVIQNTAETHVIPNNLSQDLPSFLKRKAPDQLINGHQPPAKRDLFFGEGRDDEISQVISELGSEIADEEEDYLNLSQETQAAEYIPEIKLREPKVDVLDLCLKSDDGTYHALRKGESMMIGRHETCDIEVGVVVVSRRHAVLKIVNTTITPSAWLHAIKPVWILKGASWKCLEAGDPDENLSHGARFCLAPPHSANCPKEAQFTFQETFTPANPTAVGSESFDSQYLKLLRVIEETGTKQMNKKGSNLTLGETFRFSINLRSQDRNENILPITTLRKIDGTKAVIEALWYIRGDKDIQFLQNNKCRFWDAQARDDGFVGFNYGLLTHWPLADGTVFNQLEEKVIGLLAKGQSSRNMVCTLCKPGEETVQGACTSCVQFGVTGDEELSLTVTQRSSDVILGLPHDVIAWSTILHLVRREVRRRSNRELKAGSLEFNISAGGAHVYSINKDNMQMLLGRKPKSGVCPSLIIDKDEGIFELAKSYRVASKQLSIGGYTNECCHPALKIAQAK